MKSGGLRADLRGCFELHKRLLNTATSYHRVSKSNGAKKKDLPGPIDPIRYLAAGILALRKTILA
jgi:hypothetical protein